MEYLFIYFQLLQICQPVTTQKGLECMRNLRVLSRQF